MHAAVAVVAAQRSSSTPAGSRRKPAIFGEVNYELVGYVLLCCA